MVAATDAIGPVTFHFVVEVERQRRITMAYLSSSDGFFVTSGQGGGEFVFPFDDRLGQFIQVQFFLAQLLLDVGQLRLHFAFRLLQVAPHRALFLESLREGEKR